MESRLMGERERDVEGRQCVGQEPEAVFVSRDM